MPASDSPPGPPATSIAAPSGLARFPLRLLAAAFFLSGSAALLYQVLWTRMLGHVFGVTVQAASTVLACFMAGLALGGIVAGRLASRTTQPLRAFAAVEVAIAVTALATPAALAIVKDLYALLYPSLPESLLITTFVRVVGTAAVLVIPASLMGATFPLVVSAVAVRRGEGASQTGLLYGVNTTGAIAGTLAAGLWLVPTLGVRGTFLVAAALNLAAAAGGWLAASRISSDATTEASAATAAVPESAFHLAPGARRVVLMVMTLSGFVSLALEIVWFRVLVFFLRPTTYGFASMLATVLLGLAVGSLCIGPLLRRRRDWLVVLAWIEIGVALSAILAFAAVARSYAVMEWMWTWRWLPAPLDFVLPLIGTAAVAILPPTILLGAAFPIGVLLWTDPETRTGAGRRVGLVYGVNVAGGILGALAGGFVLIPLLGAQRTLIVVSALTLAGGLGLLALTRRRPLLFAGAAATAFFFVVSATLPDLFAAVITRRYEGQTILSHRESAQSTVTVTEQRGERTLLIDGMHHASDGPGQTEFHRLIGTLGMAVHPDPRTVLVVGLGGGTTAAGAAALPSATVEVVELSDGVLAAADWFARTNGDITARPNVRFRQDDGRNHLWLSGKRYDVTTADLLLPEMAGAANLNSLEYYRLLAAGLRPGGVAVQWIPTSSGRRYRIMTRTFLAAFPHVTVWASGMLWIGSNEPITLSREAFDAKLLMPGVREHFAGVGLASFDALLGMFHAGDEEARGYAGAGPLLEDNWPVIEYFLSLPKDDPPARTDRFKGRPDRYTAPRPGPTNLPGR